MFDSQVNEEISAQSSLFKESMKNAQKRSNEEIIRMKEQIRLQNQKIQRIKDQREEKAAKVYRKSIQKQFIVEENQDLQVPVDGELQRGSRIFMMHCAPCHSLQAYSVDKKIGPALGLVYNRRAGSDKQYASYSNALVNSKLYWTPRNLYRFFQNPSSYIKGTTCRVAYGSGLKSQGDRADLIQFLRQFSKQMFTNIKIKQVKMKGYDSLQTQLYVNEEINKAKSNRK